MRPEEAFRPFVPGRDGAWDLRAAAHLLRRSGFGAPPKAVERAVQQGLEATIDGLFDEADDERIGFEQTFQSINGTLANFADSSMLQTWWVHRMTQTRVPLREKLTLFWHGHFATSFQKVGDMYLMHLQNESIRRLAWGNFRDLVVAIARDPAMIVYLDGESNVKDHPNENFARELMELFTCGIGHYTEKDVLEAARAFTGWHRDGANFVFVPDAHDDGPKRVLGKAGRFDGADVVDILMQQAATPQFIARKLLRYFADPDPVPEVVAEAGAMLDRTQLNIKWFLRDLFASRYFYSEPCRRKRISSPAECVVGTVRTLGIRMPAQQLNNHLSAMGQDLFAPPSVKGWDGEEKWINSTRWPSRVAFANEVATSGDENPFGTQFRLSEHVPDDLTDAGQIVDRLATLLFQGDLAAAPRGDLTTFLVASDDGPNPQLFREDTGFRANKVREALSTLLSLPEYHLC